MAENDEGKAGQGDPAVTPATPTPTPGRKRRYRRRLSTLRHVVTGLADVARELEGGERGTNDCRALTYVYATLASTLVAAREQDDIEARLEAIEYRLASIAKDMPLPRSFLGRPPRLATETPTA